MATLKVCLLLYKGGSIFCIQNDYKLGTEHLISSSSQVANYMI